VVDIEQDAGEYWCTRVPPWTLNEVAPSMPSARESSSNPTLAGGSEPAPVDPVALASELSKRGVQYAFGAYVDIHGVPKSKCVPIECLPSMARGSELYTVGALEGMGELGPNEDECAAIPDLETLIVLPWDTRYALAAADLWFEGHPYSHDSRGALKRQTDAAAAMGYTVNMGIEPEIYVLREVDGSWQPFVQEDGYNTPTRGYDIETTMLADPFLGPMVGYIQELGWNLYSFDHEGGDGQYEFDFSYSDTLTMCDRMIVLRLMAKHVARSLGCIATWMPKPWSSAFGSGAHINMSLADRGTGQNLFEAASGNGSSDAAGYTRCALNFTAGVLRHADALTAVLCPTVNSYKRLLPKGLMNEISWAPVYKAYGWNNRTLMARLPVNRRCLEVRTVDSASNAYLAAAMIIAAGLEGIRLDLDPGPPVNYDTYKTPPEQLAADGVHRLPRTLGDALDAFQADDLARDVFGPTFHTDFVKVKRSEWDEYNTIVGEWEREKYLRLW
jgi:glutamine synthetase